MGPAINLVDRTPKESPFFTTWVTEKNPKATTPPPKTQQKSDIEFIKY